MGDKMSYERDKARREMRDEIRAAHQISRDRKEYSAQVFMASVVLAAFDGRPFPDAGMDRAMRVDAYVEMAAHLLRRSDQAAEQQFTPTTDREE